MSNQDSYVEDEDSSLDDVYRIYLLPVADNADTRQQSFLEALLN